MHQLKLNTVRIQIIKGSNKYHTKRWTDDYRQLNSKIQIQQNTPTQLQATGINRHSASDTRCVWWPWLDALVTFLIFLCSDPLPRTLWREQDQVSELAHLLMTPTTRLLRGRWHEGNIFHMTQNLQQFLSPAVPQAVRKLSPKSKGMEKRLVLIKSLPLVDAVLE